MSSMLSRFKCSPIVRSLNSHLRCAQGTVPNLSYSTGDSRHFQFVVAGGGAGGLSVASTLGRKFGKSKVAVVEPAEVSKCHMNCEPLFSGISLNHQLSSISGPEEAIMYIYRR